ncbi:MAG: SGNH/GDSL hydrolase family protein [Gammaproteobacteria bacterium]|nr:SGNH/GDSL hydrolase family protein [Gammaproteobacteria bacterium]
MIRIPALLFLTLTASAAIAADWVGTWGASPLPPSEAAGPMPGTPAFSNQTVRQVVRISAGGEQLRLRLTNEYGDRPVEIGAARIALVADDGGLLPGSEREITFAGDPGAVLPAGAPLLSDPVAVEVEDLARVSISLYFPGDTGPCTCHATGLETAFVSAPGDHTSGTFEPAETLQSRVFLSGVEVLSEADGVVVAFGDSITDGVGSSLGENRRWPDLLAERLAARRGGGFGVVNHGISGNRVLNDGAGDSALARFDRDVLSVPGVTHVVVFEGINDIGFEFGRFEGPMAAFRAAMPTGVPVGAEALIAGYRQLIARAHSKGIEIYGATIAPYEGAAYYSEEGEAVRQAVNEWIRESGEFDAVLDFDAVLRDPQSPQRMADGLHSGDFLHGSDAGYRAVAESIDLTLF